MYFWAGRLGVQSPGQRAAHQHHRN